MRFNDKQRGTWKRTYNIFKKFKIPWHLYIVEAFLGIISTKIGLALIPYQTDIKLGKITENGVVSGLIIFTVFNLIIGVIAKIPEFYASSIVKRNLQTRMIGKVLHLPMKVFEKQGSIIINWITQDCDYAHGVITTLVGFFTGIVTSLLTVEQMNKIEGSLSFILPIVLIYAFFSNWVQGKLIFLRERRGRKANSQITAFFAEHLSFFLNMKQLHAQDEEMIRGNEAIEEVYRADIFMAIMTGLINIVSGSIQQMIMILVFVLGIPIVRNGGMTLDGLVEYQSYVLVAYGALSALPDLYTSLMYYNGMLFYVGQLFATDDEKYEREKTMDIHDNDIRFENVDFAYENDLIIQNASFTIPKGSVTAIVGPNGSGKSTIFKLIERFYTPQAGTIYFGDRNVEDIHLDEWRQSIGYVLQEPMLFNASIRDNVAYGMHRHVTDEEIIAALKLACAYDFVLELEGQLDFVIGDNGSRLSGGERQRIAIARTVMLDPSYLLLDEATCNMDVYSEREVSKALFQLMKDRTTIMISHDARMIEKANYFIVLNQGIVESQGTMAEVKQSSQMFQKLLSI